MFVISCTLDLLNSFFSLLGTGLKDLGLSIINSEIDFDLACLGTITEVGQYDVIPQNCINEIKSKTGSKRELKVLLKSLFWPFIEKAENWRLEPVERVMEFLMTYVRNRTETRAEIQLTDGNFECFRTELRALYYKTKNSNEQGHYDLALEVLSLVEKILTVEVQEKTKTASSP